MSVTAPVVFTHTLPREVVSEQDIRLLVTPGASRGVLAALYLRKGEYMPDEAKKNGAIFGYCDAEGHFLPGSDLKATHFGWRACEPSDA